MSHRRLRRLRWLVLLTFLLASLADKAAPAGAAVAQAWTAVSAARSNAGPQDPILDPPPGELVPVTPVADPHLPSLVLTVDTVPAQVAVGDLFTSTLTVRDAADDAAGGLVVTLPVPSGVQVVSPAMWTWTLATLAGQDSATFTAVGRLTAAPAGNALVLQPQAQAAGLPQPIVAQGGALLVTGGDASVGYTPGTSALLTSADGTTSVQVPGDAAGTALTLQ